MLQQELRPPRPWATLVVNVVCGLASAWLASLPGAPGWLASLIASVAAAFFVTGIGLFARVTWTAWIGEVASGVVILFGVFALYQVTQCEEMGCLGAPIVAIIAMVMVVVGVGLGIANHLAHLPSGVDDERPAGRPSPPDVP